MRIKTVIAATFALISSWSMGFSETSQVQRPKIDDSIGQYAYFRDKLPQNTLAYIRLTNPIVHLFSAKNRTNDQALQHKSSINALQGFREVLTNREQFIDRIQQLGLNFDEKNLEIITYFSSIFYGYLNGPIEAFVTNQHREFSLTAKGLVSIPVNINSIADLNMILADNPLGVEFLQFDKNGYAVDENIAFYFSPKSQRIIVSIGLEVDSLEQIQQTLAALKVEKNHEMYRFENQIDLTGQNNFFWIDLRNKSEMFTAIMENQKSWFLLKEIDGVAFGDGTNQEKQGQIKLVVKTNADKILGRDSRLQNDFNFKTVGEPKAAVILPIPTISMIKKSIETYLMSAIPSYLINKTTHAEIKERSTALYQEFHAEWIQYMGFDFEEILAFMGPNMVFYYDDIGPHISISIADKKALYNWLKQKNSAGIFTYHKNRHIHEITLQNPLLELAKQQRLSEPEHAGMAIAYPFINEYISSIYGLRVLDLNWHLYWSDEGDFIRLSSLPQMVEEERKLGHKRFNKWLTEKQGVDSENVFLAATLDWESADRRWYYNYLHLLQNSADILGTDFDIHQMPRADQLSLAESSRLGFQITTNQEFLVLSLDYGSTYNYWFLSTFLVPIMSAPLMGFTTTLAAPLLSNVISDEAEIELDADIDSGSQQEIIKDKNNNTRMGKKKVDR